MSDGSSAVDLHTLLSPQKLSAYFHVINRIIPDTQEVLWVSPDTLARDAIQKMQRFGYSQLPVKQGEAVLGIFSYRAFAMEAAKIRDSKVDLTSLTVEEFLDHERPVFARVNDDFRDYIDVLDSNDCLVVSGPDNLIAVLTPMDVLRYLHSVAGPFVLIGEIELTLRTLIQLATAAPGVLQSCIDQVLSDKYKGRTLPTTLEGFSFDDYVSLLRDGRTWPHFQDAFGGTRERVRARLEPVRDLRNDVFHFRRELTIEDFNRLTDCRNWLLRCSRKVEAKQVGDAR